MKKEAKKFILDVAPLVRLPLSKDQSFFYLSSEKLSPGTLISAPLFRRTVQGIVLSYRKDFPRIGNIKLKPISKIIEKDFLSRNQLELAKHISDYYVSPLGIVLKSFVPQITKARKEYMVSSRKYLASNKKINLNKKQKAAIKRISTKKTNTKYKLPNTSYLLYGPSGSGKTEVYIHSILELQKKDSEKQALIILPELTLTPQAIERYGAHFSPQKIVVLNSKISKGQFFSAWQKIKSGQAKIIIATRAGIFAPFKKLGIIVIDEEQDISHKQWDMNPRYDARKMAEELSRIHNCALVFGTATPRIETYFRAKNKEFQLLTIPALQKKLSPIELADMKKEYWNKKKRASENKKNVIFSEELLNEIKWVIRNKEQALLFINRQGLANFSLCSECHQVLKCPRCDRALSSQKDGHFICLHCSYKTSIFPKCPHCQNMHFKSIGLGTQKIEQEINSVFPGLKTLRMDNQTTQKSGSQEKIYQDFKNGKADILIGTQMITKGWDLPNLSLVGIIDTDSLFNIPDYFSDEKAFQLVIQAAGRTNRPESPKTGKTILQTFNPENKIYKIIQERNFEDFYQKELPARKIISIPPFGKIIKVIHQSPSQTESQEKTQELYQKLCSQEIPQTTVSEPLPAFLSKIRGKYRHQIVIKTQAKYLSKVKKELKKLDGHWIIDIDPISIT